MRPDSPMPEVTVIIATYNRSRVLRCALQSLCNQTYRDFEAWIVGDACTDDSEAIVASFKDPRLHWTNLPQRIGSQSGPNNEGLRRAAGTFVAYLGHDDLWLPWHLETLTDAVAREHADFAYGALVFLGPEGPREAYGDTKTHAQVSVSPPSGWLHHRSIVETCGPWRSVESEPIGVDVGFQARAFLAGFRFTATRRLSVLKFPSPWWGIYARHGDFPQETYLSRMIANAEQVERQVLMDLAFAYARRYDTPSVAQGVKSAMRAIQRRAGEWYGVDRWPLSQYLRWRVMRRRKRAHIQRGLPASTGQPSP